MAEEVKETKKVAPKATTKTAPKTATKAAPKAAPKTAPKAVKKVEKEAVVETPAKVAQPKVEKAPVKKTVKAKTSEFTATGKRKCSVARVRLTTGTGKITINDRDINDYFNLSTLIFDVKQPLVLTKMENKVDIVANIYGGGFTGQAGALRHGITRALMEMDEQLRPELKKAGFVTRDARIKERKKYGLKKARKASQFSKR